jgi:hypothetical protein
MRTLIYKRTHNGDPDPDTGVFGCNECMKDVRGWLGPEDAVIGVGGIGSEPHQEFIAGKLTWVGIGPQNAGDGKDGYPLLTFKHFLYYGEQGSLLKDIAPALAKRIYDGGVRLIWDTSLANEEERKDVENILDLAKNAPPSGRLEGMPLLDAEKASGESPSMSCCRGSSARKAL